MFSNVAAPDHQMQHEMQSVGRVVSTGNPVGLLAAIRFARFPFNPRSSIRASSMSEISGPILPVARFPVRRLLFLL
jgi:hypothetical protein